VVVKFDGTLMEQYVCRLFKHKFLNNVNRRSNWKFWKIP